MFEECYDKQQLQRIKIVMKKLLDEDRTMKNTTIEYLKKYLSIEDIAVFYKILCESFYDKLNEKNNKSEDKINLKWEVITPYKTLGIEEKEYSKEQLLKAVNLKIKSMQAIGKNKDIDKILDAYNEITNKQK